jgi:hypothetical protein
MKTKKHGDRYVAYSKGKPVAIGATRNAAFLAGLKTIGIKP